MKKPLVLCIMDGFGHNPSDYGNAITAAKTPRLDKLMAEYPMTYIGASGMDVGLPDGQMGNSEVGHTNIGAGRVVYQELTRITKSIADGEFFENPALTGAVQSAIDHDSALHLIGLMSDGGVHSHNTHLWALVELAKRMGLKKVYVHCLLDGRDVPPTSGADFVAECERKLKEIGVGKIATVMGRYYAMDRDNRWERVEKAYAAMVYGEGNQAEDPVAAIRTSYQEIDAEGKNITDEFVVPTVCSHDADARIMANDSVIFFNFRPDRAREITRTLVDPEFTGFVRRNGFFPLHYVCMTQYDATMPNVQVAFRPQSLENTFGEYLSSLGKTQLRIAETEKYAHVTFFFNGGVERTFPGEDRVLVPSPKVATYDLQPEMSAPEVTDKVVERILSGNYDAVIRIPFSAGMRRFLFYYLHFSKRGRTRFVFLCIFRFLFCRFFTRLSLLPLCNRAVELFRHTQHENGQRQQEGWVQPNMNMRRNQAKQRRHESGANVGARHLNTDDCL